MSTDYLKHEETPTSEELFDFPTSCGGCELVDNVQGCLAVRVAYIHIDAGLDREKQSKPISQLFQRGLMGPQFDSHQAATAPPQFCHRAQPRADTSLLWSLCSDLSQLPTTT